MKKAAILGISIFYLLFTTGMFVCAVPCAAADMAEKTGMHMATGNCCCKHSKKNTNKNSNCDCKHNGGYVIKEHIKPDRDFSFKGLIDFVFNPEFPTFQFSKQESVTNDIKFVSNSPPWQSDSPKYIQFHSLLI